MSITRRTFLCGAAALAARAESRPLDPEKLAKFVDPLPLPPAAKRQPGLTTPAFRITMSEFQCKVHRDLPATTMWGYNGSSPGPTIETRSGEGLRVEWINRLPQRHLLPVDHHIHGAEADKPDVRAIVHVHGAKAPPDSDGYPEDWYTPGKSLTNYYPNQQDPATLWYHDHAMGITRLNMYAGLFGFFLIRDKVEDGLNLPRGAYEIPLTICDRSFLENGQFDYPESGIPGAPWVPEAPGEAFLINGKIFPYLEVEPRRYRFRVLNAANSRFFHLSLSHGHPFTLIGTDQGLLPAPIEVKNMMIAPAERVDVILDFSGQTGAQIVLHSDTFSLMQFRVGRYRAEDTSSVPAKLRPVPRTLESSAVRTRRLRIVEDKMANGDSMMMLLNGMHWDMPVTENPTIDTTEIWELVNTTEDSHPIHLHLVRFQVLDRRSFNELNYWRTGQLSYTSGSMPPEPAESGWKDTVRAHALMVTRIIVRFEGYVGRYVWHCHLLEHEDNEMMRPYDVLPAGMTAG
ncbi:MAG TPA: multicopper oxidase domain-containing protein [Bryobacteraceae bacterium]|nr:multicopper oxidase domain-containing protein [Bryobacteraceae bacterium]